jgi:hypothetical protein
MSIDDQMTFRKLQYAFFSGMAEYPNDTDRMEKAIKVLTDWIDSVVDRERMRPVPGAKIIPGGGSRRGDIIN